MKFELIRSCGGGNCPALFKTENQTWLVQGRLRNMSGGIRLGEGEAVVEVPTELLAEYVPETA